ncbi:hypothetical protein N9W21_07340 [Shewanella sp.]|nr:hypothetical protein [Shewanella sp.]
MMTKFRSSQFVTALALLMLMVAAQVSTDNAGDWMLIGLNWIELTNRVSLSLPSILDVTLDMSDPLQPIVQTILNFISSPLLK